MVNNDDQFFHASKFNFWNFFIINVNYKIAFTITVSTYIVNNLNIIPELKKYGIVFDPYLITSPKSVSIAIEKDKANMPNAYLAYIIDKAEKNESIISLKIGNSEYCFTFEFLTS